MFRALHYEGAATSPEIPDLVFSLESLDVSTDTEAMLADVPRPTV